MKGATKVLKGAGAAATGVAIVLVLAGLSRVPWTAQQDPDARLRLSWRIQGEAVEACRVLDPEELAQLPVHMRNPEACQRRGRSYRLRVWVDQELRLDRVVAPSGARGDRPVYVYHETALSPGERRVEVTFQPLAPDNSDGGSEARGQGLHYKGEVEALPGRVVLITLGADATGTDALEARTAVR